MPVQYAFCGFIYHFKRRKRLGSTQRLQPGTLQLGLHYIWITITTKMLEVVILLVYACLLCALLLLLPLAIRLQMFPAWRLNGIKCPYTQRYIMQCVNAYTHNHAYSFLFFLSFFFSFKNSECDLLSHRENFKEFVVHRFSTWTWLHFKRKRFPVRWRPKQFKYVTEQLWVERLEGERRREVVWKMEKQKISDQQGAKRGCDC